MNSTELSYFEKIGENIVRCRERSGMTQAELAQRIRVDETQIADIEKGQSDAMISTLINIAKVLRVNMLELMG